MGQHQLLRLLPGPAKIRAQISANVPRSSAIRTRRRAAAPKRESTARRNAAARQSRAEGSVAAKGERRLSVWLEAGQGESAIRREAGAARRSVYQVRRTSPLVLVHPIAQVRQIALALVHVHALPIALAIGLHLHPPLHHPLVSALKSYLWSSKTCRWDGPRRTETSRRSRIRPGHTCLKFTVMRFLG